MKDVGGGTGVNLLKKKKIREKVFFQIVLNEVLKCYKNDIC